MEGLGITVPAAGATGLPEPAESAGPAWVRALHLAERVTLAAPVEPASGASVERAARRLRRWKRAYGLAEGDALPAMLATVPGGEAGLLALLGEAPSALARRAGSEPPWWQTLGQILDADATRVTTGTKAPSEGPAKSYWLRGFSRVTAPFVRHAVADLEQRLRADAAAGRFVAVEPVLTAFAADLAGDLVSLAARVLVLELNVARVQGGLRGETGPERFWSFVEGVSDPHGRTALFDEYPVLARLLVQRTESSVAATWEFLQRWRDSRELVGATLFGGADPGRVESVRFGRGDLHQGGRSVAVVSLSTGAGLVYKPRPLSVHLEFNNLLRWLNGAVDGLDLRRLAVVDLGDYGWVEFAERADCAGAEEFDRYYRRLGALMALLYAVDGADFHYENLIASGDQPVVVDLETLFHQRLPTPGGPVDADDPAERVLDASVLRLGVLPIMVRSAAGSVDLSGLGGDPSSSMPFASATWQDDGTDTMRVVRRYVEFAGGQNRPTAGGTAANPLEHLRALTEGFRAGYQAIQRRRHELTGLLERFADIEVRTVLRPTQTYSTLLSEGNHPDVLRDALNFDRHLSLLWADCDRWPDLAAVVPHELADLWAGDVPMFTARPGSRDLWTSRGRRLTDRFAERALDRARAKVAAFGEADLRRQEWIIRASMMTRPDAVAIPVTAATPAPDRAATASEPARYLAAARAIADRLVELAIHDERGRVNWLGLAPAGETAWRVRALGWDLYSGVSGVAVFLTSVSRLTGEPAYRDLALRALWSIPQVIEDFGSQSPDRLASTTGLNGLTGLPGLAYALIHVAGDDARLLDQADRAVALCGPLVDGDDALDVLAGGAGMIGSLLAVHAHTGSAEALAIARRCGERLLDKAAPAGPGLAWTTLAEVRQPLTGFSHGAAGIGWALVRLGAAVDDERFLEAGLAAFRYERAQFRPETGDWPDFREQAEGAAGQLTAWCHGAAGIGLARAGALAVLDDPAVRDDLAAALAGTVSHGFGHNHSLCHGDLGNMELLLAAGSAERDTAGRRILAELDAHGPRCGTPHEVESPSLMTGLAGIGYGLLRLAAPDRTPALLLTQPPSTPSQRRRTA